MTDVSEWGAWLLAGFGLLLILAWVVRMGRKPIQAVPAPDSGLVASMDRPVKNGLVPPPGQD